MLPHQTFSYFPKRFLYQRHINVTLFSVVLQLIRLRSTFLNIQSAGHPPLRQAYHGTLIYAIHIGSKPTSGSFSLGCSSLTILLWFCLICFRSSGLANDLCKGLCRCCVRKLKQILLNTIFSMVILLSFSRSQCQGSDSQKKKKKNRLVSV